MSKVIRHNSSLILSASQPPPSQGQVLPLWHPVWWLQQNPLLVTLTMFLGLVRAPRTEPANRSWPYHKEANRNLCILVAPRSGSFSSFFSASVCPSRSPLLRIYFITRAHYSRYFVKNANVLSAVITGEVFAPVYGVSLGSWPSSSCGLPELRRML